MDLAIEEKGDTERSGRASTYNLLCLCVSVSLNSLRDMFYPHVKSEAEASPDLSPVHHNFHFKFPPSHDHQSRTPSDPPTPLYRFGQYPTNPANPSPPSSHTISYMSYSDDYDDLPIHNYPQSASDRTIRRRSSKGDHTSLSLSSPYLVLYVVGVSPSS